MTITATTIIQDALNMLGVYAPSETMSSTDSAQGLSTLNQMLDQWAIDYLVVSQVTSTILNLSSGVGSYTIGTAAGAFISQERPERINMDPGAATYTRSGTPHPVNVVSAVEWSVRQSTMAADPDTLFYDPQYPLGVLNVSPIPITTSTTITFGALYPLVSFADLTTTYTLAKGAQEAITTGLAMLLKPYFSAAALDPLIVQAQGAQKLALLYRNLPSRALLRRGLGTTPGTPAPR